MAWRAAECYTVGIDEAGRGSLVGEMIVAAIAVPMDRLEALREMGVRDSKALTPGRRASLYRELSTLPFAAVPVRPWEIDSENLNVLTARAAATAFRAVARQLGGPGHVCRVVVDKFGSPSKLIAYLRREGYRGPVIAEEKADAKYPEVSAASIIAKHVRDSRIRVLRSMYGVEGSGYPSDPRTMRWLRRVLETGALPPVVRRSWDTLRGTPFYVDKKKGPSPGVTLEDFL